MKKDISPKYVASVMSEYILRRNSDKQTMLAIHSIIEVLHTDKILSKKFLKQLRKELEDDSLYLHFF